jgi:hypothetical protein
MNTRLTGIAYTFILCFKNTKLTIGLSIVYGFLVLQKLIQALEARPLIKTKNTQNQMTNKM